MLSVIVPAYNEENYISACLKSLNNQEKKDFELVVVNNNSTDNTEKIAKRFVKKVFLETNKGYHNAVKKGVEITKGELIAICDADSLYDKEWTKIIEEEFKKDQKVVAIYGALQFSDVNPIVGFMAEKSYFVFMSFMRLIGINITNGLNFCFKRETYLKVGGYDPKIFNQAGLDINLGMRLKKYGKIKFVPTLKAKTSLRRVTKQGIFTFISKNAKMYLSMLTKKNVKESYDEYNQEYR